MIPGRVNGKAGLLLFRSRADVPMHLSPRELDKLVLHNAGFLAQKRLARGLRLNYPEAVALIATQLLEFIRDGRSVAELMDLGRQLLGRADVMDGVAGDDRRGAGRGHVPRRHQARDRASSDRGRARRPALALYGSFLPVPAPRPPPARLAAGRDRRARRQRLAPRTASISSTKAATTVRLAVTNPGDRPIQVGSHYHFVETNRALVFDRAAAYGMRLDIPAGTAVRFEPGETKTVALVEIAGAQVIRGGNNARRRAGDRRAAAQAVRAAVRERGFGDHDDHGRYEEHVSHDISRRHYADIYGPTDGRSRAARRHRARRRGRARLRPSTATSASSAAARCCATAWARPPASATSDALDCVITNALIVDWTGIYKADVGIKNGRIAGIGKAGNPDVMAGVTAGMIVGVTTEVIAGEGLILTAGGIDAHIHFICPQQVDEALASGVTTFIGGGTGPATGTNATTCTPGRRHIGADAAGDRRRCR